MSRLDAGVRLLLQKTARVLESAPMSEEQSDLYCEVRDAIDRDDKAQLRLVSGEVYRKPPEETL